MSGYFITDNFLKIKKLMRVHNKENTKVEKAIWYFLLNVRQNYNLSKKFMKYLKTKLINFSKEIVNTILIYKDG